MSNLSELKGILTTLGGTPAASDTIAATIAKIKAAITAHGGLGNVLPTFTAAQNGKILGVVDGSLAWVDKT